jgi:hypothetical protein
MSQIQIDYSRADRDRRMELLRLYAGDLARAKEVERWIVCGETAETGRGNLDAGDVAPASPAHLDERIATATQLEAVVTPDVIPASPQVPTGEPGNTGGDHEPGLEGGEPAGKSAKNAPTEIDPGPIPTFLDRRQKVPA